MVRTKEGGQPDDLHLSVAWSREKKKTFAITASDKLSFIYKEWAQRQN